MTPALLPLVLASASPRRHDLIGRLGFEVRTSVPDVDESLRQGESGPTHALRVARAKAEVAAPAHAGLPVLAADTVVLLGELVFGKPRDRDHSREMLRQLRGRRHVVATALSLVFESRRACRLEQAQVTFTRFSDDLLEWYATTGEGDDKAGAYAIQGQGALLVEKVEGNVQSVIGLPLATLPRLFASVGLELVRSGSRLGLSRSGEGFPLSPRS